MTADNAHASRANSRLMADAMAGGPPASGPARAVSPDGKALSAARQAKGGVEDKVIAYFGALPEAKATLQAARRLTRALTMIAFLGGFAALVAGAATLRTAFGADGGVAINFHWVVASLLGLNTLTLILWLVMMAFAPRAAGDNSLGAAVLGLWRMALRRFSGHGSRTTERAAAAVGRRMGAARVWVASAVSHGLWLAFLTGGVAMALILLSTHQYVFRWETTILSAESYIALTHGMAWLPDMLGATVPDDMSIRAAQWRGDGMLPAGEQRGWAALLFSCLILYGVLPRLVLLLFSLWRARRIWRAPLDLTRPELAALIPHLAPVVQETRIVSPAPEDAARPGPAGISRAEVGPPRGPVAVAGWETDTGDALPPGSHLDLGMIDGAAEPVLTRLKARKPTVSRLIVIADLTATPDRGVTAGLKRLATAGPEPVMLFTGRTALVDRLGPAEAANRLTDWVAAAHAAGIALDHMTEIDLAHPDAEAERQWRALTGDGA